MWSFGRSQKTGPPIGGRKRGAGGEQELRKLGGYFGWFTEKAEKPRLIHARFRTMCTGIGKRGTWLPKLSV